MIEKRRLIPNSTQLPNVVVDELMATMTGNELKVYLVIIRKTVGWHKATDRISLDQISALTGIKDGRSIKKILASLLVKELINKVANLGKPSTLSALYQGGGENAEGENDRGGDQCTAPPTNKPLPTPYKNTATQNKRKQTKQNKDRFSEFYAEYPNKKAKVNAEKVFMKLPMTDDLFTQIMEALQNQKRLDVWTKDNGKYIPMPASWLNGKRWEDEIEIKKNGVSW